MRARSDDVVWKIEGHTEKKHELLQGYLHAWFPILAKYSRDLVFIDGFAGPGVYQQGEPGSPSIAVDCATQNQDSLRNSKIHFFFSEVDARRFAMLQKWAQRRSESAPPYIQIQTSNLHFEELADQLASSTLWARDPAVFAFIDPFGYKGISITSLRSLCSNPRSELLILFSFNAINRIANANVVDGTLERLFGTSQFAEAPQGDPKMRKEFLVQLYENQLRSVCRFQFISRFEMITPAGKSYFLLHCTRNPLGLEKFREVMWRVDPVSGNRFSAREGQQESLFGGEELIHLDRLILETYASKTASVADLESFVLHQTPYKKSHLRTHALRKLQSDDLVRPIGQKRKFAFPSDLKVRFAPFD